MGTEYLYSGDSAITVEFGDQISESLSNKVVSIKKLIEHKGIYGVEDVVATYRSLLVYYNPYKIGAQGLIERLKELERDCRLAERSDRKVIEIPVCYDLQYGLDLERVARSSGLSVDAVVDKHTSKEYLVYMVGFTPGFPYMGRLAPELLSPRRDRPRAVVEKGSVAIAGEQTGIYPLDSPGGWNVLGRTPVELYNALGDSPTLLKAGDYVRFIRIDKIQFQEIEELIKAGLYRAKELEVKL